MGLRDIIFSLVLVSLVCVSVVKAIDVKVSVQSVTSIANTDDTFICATLDWWPTDKCDYDQCPWGEAGILTLELTNPILKNAIKAFNPMRIRVGGSLQDQVIYNVGDSVKDCPSFQKIDASKGLFGFSNGCLHMDKWDQLNTLFGETGAKVTFGLNALYGKNKSESDSSLWVGDWDCTNAKDLMNYTISKGYKIDSYELGNELCAGGVSAKVSVEGSAKDYITLRKLVQASYPDLDSQPKVIGPAGFFDAKWFSKFLEYTGQDTIDGVSHHIYNLGGGGDKDLIDHVQDPFYLSQTAQTYKDADQTVKRFGPWAGSWVGEAGGAYNSGGKDVSHTFVNGFWYIDSLGMTATYDHKVFCRQSLIGGNYGLLNTTSFIPNPDYYGALLWHRVMGTKVLRATHHTSPYLRVYAHCARGQSGVSLTIINMSNSADFDVSVEDDYDFHVEYSTVGNVREEYHLTPENGNIQSDVVLLNGIPLKLTDELDIPELKPKHVDASFPVHVAADSIVFVTLKGFNAPACSN